MVIVAIVALNVVVAGVVPNAETMNKKERQSMEKLAKLTTRSKGSKGENVAEEFGAISPTDLAFALGKIQGDDAASNLLRFKYAHDPREGRKLLAKIAGAIILNCHVPIHLNADLAILVLENTIMPHQCAICAGHAEIMAGELKIICRACNGSGYAAKSDSHMAQALHVTKAEWLEKYEREYCTIMSIVSNWEHAGRMAIIEALLFE